MKLSTIAAFVAATALLPAAAQATLLHYEITGRTGTANPYTFNFDLDTARSPSFSTGDTLRYAPTVVTYSVPGSTDVRIGNASNIGPSFFAASNRGGISILRLNENDPQPRFFGPALFSGTTASPTFLTGTFLLSTQPRNNPNDVQTFDYQVVVRQVGAVPEPGTWGMMLVGFGAAGLTLRRRRRINLPAFS